MTALISAYKNLVGPKDFGAKIWWKKIVSWMCCAIS